MATAPVSPPFVGRAAELDAVRAVCDRALRGRGGVVVVDGEPGIGKSRLLRELVDDARRRGIDVLETTCDVAEQSIPFAPLRRLFGGAVLPGEHGAVDVSAEPALQFRIIEALGASIEARAARSPVIVAVDDLQWADEPTLAAVASLASRADLLPLAVVLTLRTGHEVPTLHALVETLVGAGATTVRVPPLDDESVATLAAHVIGSAVSTPLLHRLRGAAGNPLFVTELAAASEVAAWTTEEAAAGLPVAFRQRVVRRLAQLPTAVQDVLRIAAVLGSSFDPRHLSIALDRPVIDLEPLLARAADAGVVDTVRSQLRFRHDLVREAVYEHIPTGIRRELHREVGKRLAAAGVDVLVVAQHVALGADDVDEDAAAWLRRAAAEAAPRSPAVAVELLERARSLLPISARELNGVLTDLALAYAWTGRLADAEALGRELLAGRIDEAAATALRAGLLRALVWQGRPAEALATAGLGIDEPAEGEPGAMLAAETALAALLAFDFPRAIPIAARAEALARGAGVDVAVCQALAVRCWLSMFLGQPHTSVALIGEALTIADASPAGVAHRAHPCFFAGMPLVLLDRLDDAARHLQEGRRRAEERGLVWSLPLYHSHLGVTLFVGGRWDEAMAELEASLAVADDLGLSTPVVASAAAWMAVIQLHRDDLAGAERTVAAALARQAEGGPQGGPILSWARAELHDARGETADAIVLLQAAYDMFLAGANNPDPWSVMTLVRLLVRTGEVERAAALLPTVERQAEMTGTPYMRAQAHRCRGLIAADADALLAAVEEYRRCPRPLELAAGCEDAGTALSDEGRTDVGVSLLQESLAAYEGLGAIRDVARIRATLRRHGVRHGGARRTSGAVSGWDSLTDTERKVVDLVAQRLSNPEVAERLFISRHTVESHLKRIYRKLQLSSRAELARLVAAQSIP